jgi:hypothetical protein
MAVENGIEITPEIDPLSGTIRFVASDHVRR